MNKVTLTRQELYDLVWSEPMVSLSKKYKISDVGLRKIRIRMKIPIPNRGYWAKIHAGLWVNKSKSLSLDFSGPPEITLILRHGSENVPPETTLPLSLKKQIERELNLPESFPTELIHPGNLIISARRSLKNKDLRGSRYKKIVSCPQGEINISVSIPNIERALLFMDTLIKLLRKRGHDVKVEGYNTYAVLFNEEIKIAFRERLTIVKVNERFHSQEYQASGVLSFRIGESYRLTEWKDGSQRLEEQLSKILAKLETQGTRLKERTERWKKEEVERKERERIRQELEKRRQKELPDFKKLISQARRWHETKILRNYLTALEGPFLNSLSNDLQGWLELARKKVDWYDPLVEANDELLNDVDKEALALKKS